ncbi:MAG: hypothetical protein JWQ38_3153 [Flavipsychrobacter sp.]|nr:hypothetical protein [Flavipsychrobacter sp.]
MFAVFSGSKRTILLMTNSESEMKETNPCFSPPIPIVYIGYKFPFVVVSIKQINGIQSKHRTWLDVPSLYLYGVVAIGVIQVKLSPPEPL